MKNSKKRENFKYIFKKRSNIGTHIAGLTVICLLMNLLAGCGSAQSAGNASESAAVQDDALQSLSEQETVLPNKDPSGGEKTVVDDVTLSYSKNADIVNIDSLDADLSWTVDDNFRNYYEIFVGSFCDSDGDGTGDLKGIESRLDYIADLGCNGIWLTPIMSAPSYHKYDTSDYYNVDPAFGTNDDFRSLCEACHQKGIRIIIDMVINHSSSEHPWFKESTEYLETLSPGEEPDPKVCPYVKYYNFSGDPENGSYREVPGSDWYYEAVFDGSQPDLNLYDPDLNEELYRVADHWIGLGADGFRMDAVMHYDESDSAYNEKFLHDYYEHCLTVDPDFYMVSEVWASETVIKEYYRSLTPSFFNFDAADAEGKLIRAGRGKLSAEKFVNACLDYQNTFSEINPDYIDAPFITNHDMGRVANALQSDPVALKMTAGLLLSMSGSPFIYYGEEIGMKSKGSLDQNKRLHMNWSETDPAGICSDPEGADTGIVQSMPAADAQIGDDDSLYTYYREALRIRNENAEIARGTIEIVDALTDGDLAVIIKTWNEGSVVIAYNTGEESASVDLNGIFEGEPEIVGKLCAKGNNAGSGDSDTEKNMAGDGTGLHNTTLNLPGRSIIYLK